MKKILFVCTGNMCRSPMAVGLVKKALPQGGDVEISSAGLIVSDGLPASPNAIKVMAEEDIDISGHQSRHLTREIVTGTNVIFVMTQWHKLELINLLEKPGKEIYLIKELMKNKLRGSLDIEDPIGKSIVFYRKCRDEIKKAVPTMLEKILKK